MKTVITGIITCVILCVTTAYSAEVTTNVITNQSPAITGYIEADEACAEPTYMAPSYGVFKVEKPSRAFRAREGKERGRLFRANRPNKVVTRTRVIER